MKWLKSAWHWSVEQVIEYWPVLLVTIGSGGGATYLASVTKWIEPFGPIAWGAIGLLTVLLVTITYWIYAWARIHVMHARYVHEKLATSTVNVLSPIHENERINLADFFHPFYRATERVHFRNCELFGPAAVVFDGGTFTGGSMENCEIVVIRGDRPIRGGMKLSMCTFENCRFYRVTWLILHTNYVNLPEGMRKHVPVISDGRIGDV